MLLHLQSFFSERLASSIQRDSSRAAKFKPDFPHGKQQQQFQKKELKTRKCYKKKTRKAKSVMERVISLLDSSETIKWSKMTQSKRNLHSNIKTRPNHLLMVPTPVLCFIIIRERAALQLVTKINFSSRHNNQRNIPDNAPTVSTQTQHTHASNWFFFCFLRRWFGI